jgi:hypothetical protein
MNTEQQTIPDNDDYDDDDNNNNNKFMLSFRHTIKSSKFILIHVCCKLGLNRHVSSSSHSLVRSLTSRLFPCTTSQSYF